MSTASHVFISYHHEDRSIAIGLADALKRLGVSVWVDADQLSAGANWSEAITEGLQSAAGLIVIASEKSSQSKWVMQEIGMARALEKGIFPVVVGHWENMPTILRNIQGVLLPSPATLLAFDDAARKIAVGLRHREGRDTAGLANFQDLSDALLREAKTINEKAPDKGVGTPEAPNSIFVVHGHNEEALKEVTAFVSSLGVRPVVLREVEGGDQSLLQRFFRIGSEAKFAIVILSADDVGAGRFQFDAPEIGEKALQFRARQNVILEMGFFFGQLGWDHVFVLLKDPDKIFPNFEVPSDISGAVYDRIDRQGRWKRELTNKLRKSGFGVSGSV